MFLAFQSIYLGIRRLVHFKIFLSIQPIQIITVVLKDLVAGLSLYRPEWVRELVFRRQWDFFSWVNLEKDQIDQVN